MAASFSNNYSLKKTGFAMTAQGFTHRGVNYIFDDVVETRCARTRLETRYLMVGSEYTHAIAIALTIKSGEQVRVTEKPTWFSSSSLANVERIQEAFDTICKHTFVSRANKYLAQIYQRGFFEYSGWHFCPNEKKFVNKATKVAYSAQSSELSRSYGFIEVRDSSAAGSVLRAVKGRIGIDTLTDTDVFLALLNRFFGNR